MMTVQAIKTEKCCSMICNIYHLIEFKLVDDEEIINIYRYYKTKNNRKLEIVSIGLDYKYNIW